jgi:UPF0176 protein
MSSHIYVLLYYKYTEVAKPDFEVLQHKLVCAGIGLKGRIIIASEGINGTVAGTSAQLKQYTSYMNSHPVFGDIVFKRTAAAKVPFGKLIVKLRPEIVTLGKQVDLKNSAEYLSPEKLHKMFEQKTKMVIIDMRNSYEHEVGHFEGSLDPGTDKFYELPQKLSTLSKYKSHKVITVCTGGIRCEKASALLKEEGFEDVSQLEGGIVKYLEKYPNGYFKGKNFVFDERMVTNTDTQSGKNILSKCVHCQKPCDRYLDCTRADCHKLYISCANCEKSHSGRCPAETMKVTIQ